MGAAPCPAYRDHIEAHHAALSAVASHKTLGRAPDLVAFVPVDGFFRRSSRVAAAPFDLHEYESVMVHRDQVYLRAGRPEISRHDSKSLMSQVAFRKIFAMPPERES